MLFGLFGKIQILKNTKIVQIFLQDAEEEEEEKDDPNDKDFNPEENDSDKSDSEGSDSEGSDSEESDSEESDSEKRKDRITSSTVILDSFFVHEFDFLFYEVDRRKV